VGITDYAQDALGDVVYVSLPELDSAVAAMGTCCEVESTKSVSEVFAPVSGRVVEVNSELADAPQTVNEDPYGKGWIFAVEMADPAEADGLMDAAAYRALVENL
jgi:glycine cleavage system H protein